ncbi:Uncharacterized protein TCM_043925 [Theobroma cacao]|uniref:Uncharacterized protein n=1 Tax=Theobroma cacao TaxID=3641 RepID=A0A061FQ40_THECC|nr:Uncharacterized protein TCM_043925 [Theobroma cacao]
MVLTSFHSHPFKAWLSPFGLFSFSIFFLSFFPSWILRPLSSFSFSNLLFAFFFFLDFPLSIFSFFFFFSILFLSFFSSMAFLLSSELIFFLFSFLLAHFSWFPLVFDLCSSYFLSFDPFFLVFFGV